MTLYSVLAAKCYWHFSVNKFKTLDKTNKINTILCRINFKNPLNPGYLWSIWWFKETGNQIQCHIMRNWMNRKPPTDKTIPVTCFPDTTSQRSYLDGNWQTDKLKQAPYLLDFHDLLLKPPECWLSDLSGIKVQLREWKITSHPTKGSPQGKESNNFLPLTRFAITTNFNVGFLTQLQ